MPPSSCTIAFEILERLGNDRVLRRAAGSHQRSADDRRDARARSCAERAVVGLRLLQKVGGLVDRLGNFCVIDFRCRCVFRKRRIDADNSDHRDRH